jgi:small subunit ribosomal protein S8
MSIDMIGDFLTVIRNGLMVTKRSVSVQHSRLRQDVAQVLKDEGYIRDFKVTQEDGKKALVVGLKYVDGESVIHEINRVSRPGRRHYEGRKEIKPVIGGLGVAIVTTSKGVMSDKKAQQAGVGGEVICHVW